MPEYYIAPDGNVYCEGKLVTDEKEIRFAKGFFIRHRIMQGSLEELSKMEFK